MQEADFVEKIRSSGGRVFVVGGYVRDKLMGRPPKDKDYVISGIQEQEFCVLFPDAKRVGKSFPVYLEEINGKFSEIAFARKEQKAGKGYRGFTTEYDAAITIEEDLYRRDSTMNSIAWELPGEILLDPYHGVDAIRAKEIRAVSAHFLEDPVRALRAARQSAELGFTITDQTFSYMKACKEELRAEPQERLFAELTKALASEQPSLFFRNLQAADLLQLCFPEIHALIGKTQPKDFHPEGDAFEHSMQVVDFVAKRNPKTETRFAALCHDLGKGRTPADMLPHHYGHEICGGDVLREWNARMTLPKIWMETAEFAISMHMRAPRIGHPGKKVDLLMALYKSKLSTKDFNDIILADHGSLPDYLRYAGEILPLLLEVSGNDAPKELRGKKIAEWIRRERIRKFTEYTYNTQ